jgi:hypothetical protein
MTRSKPVSDSDVRRAVGCILIVVGLFVAAMGAVGLIDEWNWHGAVIAPCFLSAKGERSVVTCEVRLEGRPPILFSFRSRVLWDSAPIGKQTEVEYQPRDPARFRHLAPTTYRNQTPGHYYRLRGIPRLVVCAALVAAGAWPLLYGLRLRSRRSSREERSSASATSPREAGGQ